MSPRIGTYFDLAGRTSVLCFFQIEHSDLSSGSRHFTKIGFLTGSPGGSRLWKYTAQTVRQTPRIIVDLPANDSPIGILSLSDDYQNTGFVIRLRGMMLLHMSRTQSVINLTAACSALTFSVDGVHPLICAQTTRMTALNLQTDRLG